MDWNPTHWLSDYEHKGDNLFKPQDIGVNQQFYGNSPTGASDMSERMFKGEGLSNTRANTFMGQSADAFNTAMGGPGLSGENPYLTARDASDREGDQTQALGLMRDAAMGNAPSVAQIQMRQGLDQALGNQQAMAGGARGAGGLALAGGNAAANMAMLQNQGSANSGMLRAQEMAQARGAYGDLSGAVRAQDLQRLKMSNDLGMNNANNTNSYRTAMGNVGAAYGANGIGAGNTAHGYANSAMDPYNQQLGANLNTEGLRLNSAQNTQNLRSGIAGSNRAMGLGQMNNLYKMGGAAVGSASANYVGPNSAKNSKTDKTSKDSEAGDD